MATIERQNLWALVDAADMAVRVASQLRKGKAGITPTDMQSLARAKEFLRQAEQGGALMAGKAISADASMRNPSAPMG